MRDRTALCDWKRGDGDIFVFISEHSERLFSIPSDRLLSSNTSI